MACNQTKFVCFFVSSDAKATQALEFHLFFFFAADEKVESKAGLELHYFYCNIILISEAPFGQLKMLQVEGISAAVGQSGAINRFLGKLRISGLVSLSFVYFCSKMLEIQCSG